MNTSRYVGVESIQKVIRNRKLKYEIILKPNYSFESTGTQLQYCECDDGELKSLLNEIIYCDGENASRANCIE